MMRYIELPPKVTQIKQSDQGYYYFEFQDRPFFLKDIINMAENARFIDQSAGLSLYVGTECPQQDKLYVEYLPAEEVEPSTWCKLYNGKDKHRELLDIV